MDLTFGVALVALLVVASGVARHLANKARRQREALRRQKRLSRAKHMEAPDTGSVRSDMRAMDTPIGVIDAIQKRAPRPPENAPDAKPQPRRK